MSIAKIQPRKSLNKAFLKVKPIRKDIELFKANLIELLNRCNESEYEEFNKNLMSDFLKNTYYSPNYFINTKERNDLVIHNGKNAKSSVGVLIEAKTPSNKYEMLQKDNINTKAFHELILYYLRERILGKNLDVKHLIATNVYEWFIFDAQVFEKLFAQNKKLVKQFNDFETGRLSGKNTDFFYKEIAEPFIANILTPHPSGGAGGGLEFTYFNLKDYEKPLKNEDLKDDNKLIVLYKIFAPEHLLKLPFANDSNSLDKTFYSELLYIMGLAETKQGGKKVIERAKGKEQNEGSLIENAINQLDYRDKLSQFEKPSQFGDTREERLYHVALDLAITWINRILFLKLLEAQLIKYHQNKKDYAFLNTKTIPDFDELDSLFFQVLARKNEDRRDSINQKFGHIPYLNSSLFEPTDTEQKGMFVTELNNSATIPYFDKTVLRNTQGKKLTGEIDTLTYLFQFLEAYDFSSEGSEEIQEENKSLINASVLGLIFEKINGYKDGSFFTPGFITMDMCRKTIRNAVIQKFKDQFGWNIETFEDIKNYLADRRSTKDLRLFNELINAIRICDPAVGSGHFLVSSLNELIVIKYELGILIDRNGQRISDYEIEIENDELIITDQSGNLFEYHVNEKSEALSKKAQNLQETLFHEKQTLIENCLFGVDINPNSVKICRLRLWIELLKNAYYKTLHPSGGDGGGHLETLPNLDINIKTGNSLISRFDLDTDLKKALKDSKWNLSTYRDAVATYRYAKSKEEKREMEQLINDIKNNFRSEINRNDPKLKKLYKKKGELDLLTTQSTLFERSKTDQKKWQKEVESLTKEIKKIETEVEEIKNNAIYENAFEWRFEFPEVLDDEGNFVGFDVVIGNPPYIKERDAKNIFKPLRNAPQWKSYIEGKMDLWYFFLHLAFNISHKNTFISYITNSYWMKSDGSKKLINRIYNEKCLYEIIDFDNYPVFEEVSGKHMVHSYLNDKRDNYEINIVAIGENNFNGNISELNSKKVYSNDIIFKDIIRIDDFSNEYFKDCSKLGEFYFVSQGVVEAPDKLNSKNIPAKYNGIFNGGEGIFVINKKELDNLNLNIEEYSLIKKY